MNYGKRLKELRERKKLSQQQLADSLNINRSTYERYELAQTQPDFETLQKLADFYEVSTDYLLGREENKVNVAGQEINLTPEEYKVFEVLKKHPVLFHDLASDPEKKIKELIKLYQVKKMFLEEDEEEYGDGFGEFDD